MDPIRDDVDADVGTTTPEQWRELILKTRLDIRWHRDQRGHDRCWLDDVRVYSNLPEYVNPYERRLPSRREFLGLCESFYERRQSPTVSGKPDAGTSGDEDADLESASPDRLRGELLRLRAGIRVHEAKGRTKAWEDDQRLYSLLPDRAKATTTLPPRAEFLDGCRDFYASRGDPPKLHEW
jgi:hypothetical protein